jgi:hypothetical protein
MTHTSADFEPYPTPRAGWHSNPKNAVSLCDCDPFETCVVVTSRNVYDLVVLPGRGGEVLVRGGHYFPEFRHAILVGSTGGGSALKLNRIEVGLRMELRLDDKTVTTSQVQSLSTSSGRSSSRDE